MRIRFKKSTPETTPLKIPQHVAIIMDGNGRWAKKRGLPRVAGHRAGAETVRKTVETCKELGISYLTLYAFSSENWNRPEKEVASLMGLLERFLTAELKVMIKMGVKLRAIGRTQMLPEATRQKLEQAIEETSTNTCITVTLALSYGGREEIIDATKKLAQSVKDGELDVEEIDNTAFSNALYAADTPDPDLLIRTSGEMRLSNFLLWQLSYAEIVVTQKNWPDFKKEVFLDSLREYSNRERRFGKL